MLNLEFNYAIKFTDGTYYTGRVNSDNEPNAWKGNKDQAFTYTMQGAYRKIDSIDCFKNCTVERVL